MFPGRGAVRLHPLRQARPEAVNAGLVVGLAAVISAPLVAWLTANRKLSGRIGTTEATRLWDAQEEIRVDYRDRLAATDKRTIVLEERQSVLEAQNNALTNENRELRRRLDTVEKENTDLRDLVMALQERLGRER